MTGGPAFDPPALDHPSPEHPALDHLVLAGPDLAALVADFTARTGVTPARGGSHTGRGTANHLVGLGGTSYLELIGPDPEQAEPAAPRPFGLDDLTAVRVVTWAVRPDDLDATIARACATGYDPGDASAMSRRTPAGDELRWRLTPDRGPLPFLIDWGSSTHPTAAGLPTVGLASFRVRHPHPGPLREHLLALGVTAEVEPAAAAGLRVVLTTPRGPVEY